MLSLHDIIDETVEYYKNNPRSLADDKGTCLYNGSNGEKCAFSRCCTEDSAFLETASAAFQDASKLLPQYAHYPIDKYEEFWNQLQCLHDLNEYWNENGLSEVGERKVSMLKSEFKN